MFGTQDIPSLEKAIEAEGKAILDNTAVKYWGRLTSDEDSRTAGAAIKSGGKVHLQKAENMTLERGAMANHLRLDDSSSMREVSVIDYQDLTQQENGELTVVMGIKGEDDLADARLAA